MNYKIAATYIDENENLKRFDSETYIFDSLFKARIFVFFQNEVVIPTVGIIVNAIMLIKRDDKETRKQVNKLHDTLRYHSEILPD